MLNKNLGMVNINLGHRKRYRRISGKAKEAASEARAMSALHGKSMPPPRTAPVDTEISGTASVSNAWVQMVRFDLI